MYSFTILFSFSQVIFDNGTNNIVTEEFIYSLKEPLPRRVRDKLKVRPCPAQTATPTMLLPLETH